jgi:hypothetical protein
MYIYIYVSSLLIDIHLWNLQASALFTAADEGHFEIVKELVAAGADEDKSSPDVCFTLYMY